MTKNYLRLLLSLSVTLCLGACSGGGGGAGSTDGSNSPAPTTSSPSGGTSSVTDLLISLDKTQVNNSGSQNVGVVVTALDASRNSVAAADVSLTVDQGAVFSTSATSKVTDASGKFSGSISIGSNKSDRTVTVTAASNGVTKTTAFQVVGSAISVTFVPSSPLPGQAVVGSFNVVDATKSGIAGVTLALSGVSGLPATVTTDAQGNGTASFTAPAAGSYSVTVSGSGVSPAPFPLIVSSGGGGGVPNASVAAALASASLSINPSVIGPNSVGSATNKAQLKALFQSGVNVGIQNMRVRFEIVGNPLGSGESISSGSATVLSDTAGIALSNYIAGTRSSPTNGVLIKMCYSEADFVAPACPYSTTATLTVASAPLSVSIGDENTLTRGASNVSYIKRFAVFVVDSAGAAVSGAPVSISVDINNYLTGAYAGSTVPRNQVVNATCLNEDTNRNGVNDPGEDLNGNGQLDPRKADMVVSYDNASVTTTDSNGVLIIKVEYSQNVATWIDYTLKVTVNAAGSEGAAKRTLSTNFIIGDDLNGSFLRSPYGIGSCTSYVP